MAEVVGRYHPAVRLIPNPERTLGHGVNRVLRVMTGEVVVRCDAHTTLSPGYIRRAVETLRRTGAGSVGGRQVSVGVTLFERAVALAITSMLGAGNARHRIGGAEGPAKTAYLGVFRRDALEAVGGINANLTRNQDYELNWRLRKNGEKVWFDPSLAVYYQPRGSLRKLARQYFDYGRWKHVVVRMHLSSLRARQVAAPLLVLGLAASGVLGLLGAPWWMATATPALYLFVLLVGSIVVGIRQRSPAAVLLPLVLLTIHLSWGIGFFVPARIDK